MHLYFTAILLAALLAGCSAIATPNLTHVSRSTLHCEINAISNVKLTAENVSWEADCAGTGGKHYCEGSRMHIAPNELFGVYCS